MELFDHDAGLMRQTPGTAFATLSSLMSSRYPGTPAGKLPLRGITPYTSELFFASGSLGASSFRIDRPLFSGLLDCTSLTA